MQRILSGRNRQEGLSTSTETRNLLELGEKDKQELQKRLDAWDGSLRIFVHPFYVENSYYKGTHHLFEGHEKPGKYLKKMANMEAERTPPLVILAEYTKIPKLKKELQGALQKIYIVPTEANDPQIFRATDSLEDPEKKLRDTLAELGTRRILIGGEFLWADPNTLEDRANLRFPERFDFEDQRPHLSGCVGKAVSILKDDRFIIELSNFAYPDSYKTVGDTFR